MKKIAYISSMFLLLGCSDDRKFPEVMQMQKVQRPKKLIFDQPFLLIFKKREANNPYLMGWIQNSELMKLRGS